MNNSTLNNNPMFYNTYRNQLGNEMEFHSSLPSKKKKLHIKSPLKNNSNELVFKGLSSMLTVKQVSSFLDDKAGHYLTKAIDEISTKTKGKYFIKEGSKLSFKDRKIATFFFDSLTYPFVDMPKDLLNFSVGLLRKIPYLGKTSFVDNVYNFKFLSNHRNKILLQEQADSIQGFFSTVESAVKKKLNPDNEAIDIAQEFEKLTGEQKNEIINQINDSIQKVFDPSTGKYNTVKERSLNRIVSGTIPAFFLANDAYNLSRLIKDDAKEADKEHKSRLKQELARVGMTAYMQLVILGAFTKMINANPWMSAFLTLLPVVVAETSSRLLNNKPITFISAKKAEIMADNCEKIKKITTDKSGAERFIDKSQERKIYAWGNFKSKDKKITFKNYSNSLSPQFSKFEQVPNNRAKFIPSKNLNNFQGNEADNHKSLFSLKNIAKAASFSVVTGLVLTKARKFNSVEDIVQKVFKKVHDVHYKIVKTKSEMTQAEFNNFIETLKNKGFVQQAEYYSNIVKNNAEITDGIIRLADKDVKYRPVIDCTLRAFEFAWNTVSMPFKLVKWGTSLIFPSTKNSFFLGKQKFNSPFTKEFQEASVGLLHLKNKMAKLSDKEFENYMQQNMFSAFNNISKSKNSNADLASLVKVTSSAATSWFLIADNYNMVMLKSKGKNKKDAEQKAQERAIQRFSGIFYQALIIKLFNNLFKSFYHATLAGMATVTCGTTVLQEIITRKAIGMPILKHSEKEILEIEKQNQERKGLTGAYFRFMSALSGKKTLSERKNKPSNKSEKV